MQSVSLDINQGESFCFNLTANNADGTSFNLSGYNLRSYIKPRYSATGFVAFSGLVTNATSGIVQLSLTSTQTNNLSAGIHVYDVEAYTTGVSGIDDQVQRLLNGHINIFPNVTT